MTSRAIDIVSPRFIAAKSRKGLENKMRDLVIKTGKQYDFYFFMQDDKGYIAWYREEIELNLIKQEGKE